MQLDLLLAASFGNFVSLTLLAFQDTEKSQNALKENLFCRDGLLIRESQFSRILYFENELSVAHHRRRRRRASCWSLDEISSGRANSRRPISMFLSSQA